MTLSYGDDAITLDVRDDGVGLDGAALSARPEGGFGLHAMRERVEALAGELTVESGDGAGTTVVATVPTRARRQRSRRRRADVIRILVVDDHPVVRDGLRGMLGGQEDLEVVGEAADGLDALARVGADQPDVVLLDLRMPRLDGVGTIERLTRDHPAVRVLVLTTFDSDADIVRAVEAGAAGYLLKDAPREELFRAVRACARGEAALAPRVAARLMSQVARPASARLSAREVEVLGHVARGATNREVAGELFVSEATVKTHLLRAFEKLGVDDRTAAVTAALERGLLQLESPDR